jgi:hypothetical protein
MGVVAPSWWWGVVFDLWIVVASIDTVQRACLSFGGVGVFVVCDVQFQCF